MVRVGMLDDVINTDDEDEVYDPLDDRLAGLDEDDEEEEDDEEDEEDEDNVDFTKPFEFED